MSASALTFKYQYDRGGHPIDFHSHPRYEIYYFHGRKCNYLIGGRIYVLQPGDLLLMHGMTLHRPHVNPNEEYVRSTVHFEPSFVQGLTAHYGLQTDLLEPFRQLHNYLLPLRGSMKAEAEDLLGRMARFYPSASPVDGDRFMLAFLDLLLFIRDCCRQPLNDIPELPSEKEQHAQRVISYLETQYSTDLSMDRIEKELHLSKFYLTRIFKEVTGVTIFTYLFQRRINEAMARFMMNPQLPVSEVSYDVGFKHHAHFTRMFKKHAGCTPEQYRKRMHAGGMNL